MRISPALEKALAVSNEEAEQRRHEFICVEHLLYALLQDPDAVSYTHLRAHETS